MEEADNLLIEQLKQVNIRVKAIEDIDSEIFIKALIACFEHISGLLSKEDNFIDLRFLKSQDIKI
jgi:hypothetical protein